LMLWTTFGGLDLDMTGAQTVNLDMFSLRGKVALVTGASSGIGYVLAKGIARAGAKVAAGARREEQLDQVVREIQGEGGQGIAVRLDVTDRASVVRAFDATEQTLGVADIIVCNAGTSGPKNFLHIDAESRDLVFDTNFKGTWDVGQEGARRLVAAKKPGSIINISSVLGLGVQPGQASYSSSKGAVIQLTRAMAVDLMRYDIRVNSIAPGWFRTELSEKALDTPAGQDYIKRMPARRLGQLSELVGPVVFLASNAGSFVNGAILAVDGALSAVIA
jgi:NAD(P)-dependent dehydrogenase (short-subunit alcohol dehydrogenase family)